MILNLLFTPLLISKLGEAAYGLQSLVNVVIGYFMVADMGMDIPVIKYIAEYNAKNDFAMLSKIVNNTFQIYFIIGLSGMLTIGLFSDILINNVFSIPIELIAEAKIVFILTCVGFAGSIISMWGRAVCSGLQRYDIANGINIASNFISTVTSVLAVILGYGIVGFIIVRIVFSFLSGAAYLYSSWKLLPSFKFSFGFDLSVWKLLKSQIGYGFILRISGILGGGLDRTLIGSWIGVAAVGIYAVPFMIVNSIGYLIPSMIHFIFPMTSALHSTNKTQELMSLFLKGSKFIMLLATLLFFPILLYGDKFLSLWLGVDFSTKSSLTLQLLSLSFYINSILYLIANVFMVGIGKINVFTKFAVSKSIIMAIGFLFFIKPYGIAGAGIAMLISCIVDILFFIVTVKKYLIVSIRMVIITSYIKPLSLAIITGIVVYFLRPFAVSWIGLIGACSTFVLIYVGLGYYFNIFEEEKQIVTRLLNSLMGKWK